MKSVGRSDRRNPIHLTGNTCIMHSDNRFGFWVYGIFDKRFIYIQRVGTNINKDRHCATQNKGVCGRDKGVRRHDHFVAGVDIQQERAHFQSRCARMG